MHLPVNARPVHEWGMSVCLSWLCNFDSLTQPLDEVGKAMFVDAASQDKQRRQLADRESALHQPSQYVHTHTHTHLTLLCRRYIIDVTRSPFNYIIDAGVTFQSVIAPQTSSHVIYVRARTGCSCTSLSQLSHVWFRTAGKRLTTFGAPWQKTFFVIFKGLKFFFVRIEEQHPIQFIKYVFQLLSCTVHVCLSLWVLTCLYA